LYIVKRTQIYLDDEQTTRLDERAAVNGATRSELIRRAVDAYLDHPDGRNEQMRLARFKEAVEQVSGSAPYLTHDYVEEMRAAGARKLDRLEKRGLD
jgi:metal-responsive CopG/Arc/MetJ family transcriptional regulator